MTLGGAFLFVNISGGYVESFETVLESKCIAATEIIHPVEQLVRSIVNFFERQHIPLAFYI